MKRLKKVVNIIFIILSILMMFSFIIPKFVYAEIDPSQYNPTQKEGNEITTEIIPVTNKIYSILFVLGIVVAVIGLMIIGLSFIVGGVEGQVEAKKKLVPVAIGCLMIGAIAAIVSILLNIGQNINTQ